MTRRFLDDVRSDVDTVFADNITGDITPAALRGVMHDVIDSCVNDEAGIASTAETLDVAIGAAWTELTTAYDVDILAEDPAYLTPDFTTGKVTTSSIAGFSYRVIAQVVCEVTNNARIDMIALQNGAPFGALYSQTGEGAGDPITLSLRTGVLSAGADDEWSVALQMPDGGADIDILDAYLFLEILPTNNP